MKRLVVLAAAALAPLCASAAGTSSAETEYGARVERYAAAIFLSGEAVSCRLRTVEWADNVYRWFYAGGLVDQAELFPNAKGHQHTDYMQARFSRAIKEGGAAANPTACAKLRDGGLLDEIDKQVEVKG